eukprot:8598916-Lingulodinium_polyedra.AAC.1
MSEGWQNRGRCEGWQNRGQVRPCLENSFGVHAELEGPMDCVYHICEWMKKRPLTAPRTRPLAAPRKRAP